MEVCPRYGKFKHESRKQATKQLVGIKRSKHYDGNVYRCTFCGFWHIGESRAGKRKPHKMAEQEEDDD